MLKTLASSSSMFTSFSSPKGSNSRTASSNGASHVVLVAGMDISQWEVVEVEGVPPGSLGILLDGNHPDAAVLEDFAPITGDGVQGAVEKDGRVHPGSILVGVNDYDLMEHRLSLQEVGRVLRETSHLMRTLYFKVPPMRSLNSLDASGSHGGLPGSPTSSSATGEIDNHVLMKGMAHSSYKERHHQEESDAAATGGKRSWNLLGMLSPTQLVGSVAALSGFGGSSTASSAAPPPGAVTPVDATQVEMPPQNPASPGLRTAAPTMAFTSSTQLAVTIPPGPIGLNLDGAIADRAVVLGFLPLPDGSTGVLERRGDIPRGSILVTVNGADVSHSTLEEVRSRLGALAGFERELVFQLPLPETKEGGPGSHPSTKKDHNDAFNRLSDLDKRRKIELSLVLKHDKTKIKRHECWFLVDAHWMASWVEFTARGGVPPGPITNHSLLEKDWEARVSGLAEGRPDAPRAGLEILKDYRCVPPMVWALYAEFHGTNNVPVQARYVLDAYAEPLVESEITSVLQQSRLQAASLINNLRDRYPAAFV